MIRPDNPALSIVRQCRLASIGRSTGDVKANELEAGRGLPSMPQSTITSTRTATLTPATTSSRTARLRWLSGVSYLSERRTVWRFQNRFALG